MCIELVFQQCFLANAYMQGRAVNLNFNPNGNDGNFFSINISLIFKVRILPFHGRFQRNADRLKHIPDNITDGQRAFHIPANKRCKFFRTKHVNWSRNPSPEVLHIACKHQRNPCRFWGNQGASPLCTLKCIFHTPWHWLNRHRCSCWGFP